LKNAPRTSAKIISRNLVDFGVLPLALFVNLVIVGNMSEPHDIPNDLPGSQALNRAQAATISQQAALLATQGRMIEELGSEMAKLRKLLSQFINGHRSEKRIITGPDQNWLAFDNSQEFQAARAEAEAQAEAVIQTYTVERKVKKKPRDESLPSHLRRKADRRRRRHAADLLDTRRRTIIGYARPRRWSISGPSCTCW
jgi:hypothetical protein